MPVVKNVILSFKQVFLTATNQGTQVHISQDVKHKLH